MDSEVKIMLERADNEILAAKALKKLSEEEKIQQELNIPKKTTFYSLVINHSYYSIFYSARAYLISKRVKLFSEQGIHQQVYYEFKKMVVKGEIDRELLKIYEEVRVKAESLLEILKIERGKRANFTYETIPQANKAPAEDSLNNAIFFAAHIKEFLDL